MRASQKIGAPARSAAIAASAAPGEKMMSAAISTMPQAWMMRTATRSSGREKRARSASARMIAKERAVDLGAVADVVGSASRATPPLDPLRDGTATSASERPRRGGRVARAAVDDEIVAASRRATSVTASLRACAQPLAQPLTCSTMPLARASARRESRASAATSRASALRAGRRAGAGDDGETRIVGRRR